MKFSSVLCSIVFLSVTSFSQSKPALSTTVAAGPTDPTQQPDNPVPLGAISQSSNSKEKNPRIQLEVTRFQLPNGLTVILHEDHSVPLISYHTWYRVGSKDEVAGATGAAHMLEHMMFKGSKKYSGQVYDKTLHENGITNNAFTTTDYTGFYENLPKAKLELMMDMEMDRMRFLTLDPKALESELKVVSEERRWRVDNNPRGQLHEALNDLAYPQSPYHWPVIGYMKDIEQYTVDKLRPFYDSFYVPNNAVLVMVGDFDSAKMKSLIEKNYGSLQSKALPQKNYSKDPDQKQPRFRKIQGQVQAKSFVAAFPGVPTGHVDSYALDLLANILGYGSSSRLYKDLVYQREEATSVSIYNSTDSLAGLFQINVSLKPGKNFDFALNRVRAEIVRLRSQGVTEMELEKAKNQVLVDFVDGLTTTDGKARSLALNEIQRGSWDALLKDIELYNAVTVAQIKDVATKYLQLSKENVVVLESK